MFDVFYIGRGDRFDDDRRRVRPREFPKTVVPMGPISDADNIAKAATLRSSWMSFSMWRRVAQHRGRPHCA
jgi:hypothetical protein